MTRLNVRIRQKLFHSLTQQARAGQRSSVIGKQCL